MNEKKYSEERNKITNDVVHLGSLDVYGVEKKHFKQNTQNFYLRENPTTNQFAEYLRSKYGWHSVSVFDNDKSFNIHDFHYNDAGLQFKVRDENRIIKLECLDWKLVAKITAKQIESGEYIKKPSILKALNSFANNYPDKVKEEKAKSIIER